MSVGTGSMPTMTAVSARAVALVQELFGLSDPVADHVVEVLHAQGAALEWVREKIGTYPAPRPVAAHLEAVAQRLRSGVDRRDPVVALQEAAEEALATYQATVS